MTPQQEAEAIEIELELRKRRGSGAATETAQPQADLPAIDTSPNSIAQRMNQSPAVLTASDVQSMGLRGAPPAIGQAIGAQTGFAAPVAVPLLGAIGGAIGEMLADFKEGRSPKPGAIISGAISGAIPGAPLANAGAKQVAKEGLKYAASELVGKYVQTTVDEGRIPDPEEALTAVVGGAVAAPVAKAFDAGRAASDFEEAFLKRNENFRALRKAGSGVTVSPPELGKGHALTALAGSVALEKKIALKNQVEWQKLVRSELGLPEDGPFRKAIDFDAEIMPVRQAAYEPYQAVQAMHEQAVDELSKINRAHSSAQDLQAALNTPEAKKLLVAASADVDLLKKVREDARAAYESLKTGRDPEAYEKWKGLTNQAEAIETAIEEAATNSGDAELLKRLRNSRKVIAQTYTVENAMNKDTGLVDAIELGAMKEDGAKLSGNLEKIGAFANSFNKEAVDAARARNRGDGKMTALLSANQASRGNIGGAIGAASSYLAGPLLRRPLMSDFYQNYLLRSPDERQSFSAALARFMAESAQEERADNQQLREAEAVP